MRERDVENHLRKQVKKAGGKVFKWASPGQRGVPDDIVFINGQIWFVEVKKPGGKLTKLQQFMLDFLSIYTNNITVIYSKEEVDAWVADRMVNEFFKDY